MRTDASPQQRPAKPALDHVLTEVERRLERIDRLARARAHTIPLHRSGSAAELFRGEHGAEENYND